MNILLVHNFYQQPGGEDQVFADEGGLLERHGHTVARFTMDNDQIEGMGRLELAGKTIWNKDARRALRGAARQLKADIVHFHNTFPLISPAGYYGAHDAGAAVVQTLHNYRLLCPAATFYRQSRVCEQCLGKSVPWPGVLHKCYRDSRVASTAIASMLTFHRIRQTWSRQIDLYIALTEFSRQKFVVGGLPPDKIAVKPNFVDPDPGIGVADGNFAVFVGRLTDEKGVRTLLEAWKHLGRTPVIPLRVIGDGPLRDEVVAQAKLNAGIEYLGRRKPDEVYAMMGAARMLVFPSQWFEGQPRTIIESLAKGTPVIAARLGSMPELVEHQRTGRLFEAGNARDLADQVRALWDDTQGRQRMRQDARAKFQACYTAAQNYQALMSCYQRARAGTG
jgi:glycosyltransferase involved in cell wall biosynthesis